MTSAGKKWKSLDWKALTRRSVIYLIGIVILALGITMNTKTNLGVSPIISIPYNINCLIHWKLGTVVFLFYCFQILLQAIILRKDFHWIQLLQVGASFFTSLFVQVFDDILPVYHTLIARSFGLVGAIILTGIGAGITVRMNLVPNPADGLASTMSTHIFHKNLGFGKNALDLISIVLSAAIGWFGAHSLLGVGIGTLCCMIFTGRVIALIRKPLDHLYDFAVTGQIPARGARESESVSA